MKSELKQQWIKALTSGEYKQGHGSLKSGNQYGTRFCCLGVLEDIVLKNDPIMSPSADRHGLDDKWRNYTGVTHQQVLIDQNDIERMSFSEIAKWIEDNL